MGATDDVIATGVPVAGVQIAGSDIVPRAGAAFGPEPPETLFPPPTAGIDPDISASWLRRLAPLLRAHRRLLVTGVAAAVVATAVQLAAPRVLRLAIDGALVPAVRGGAPRQPLAPYVWALVGLALARLVLGYVSRYRVARTGLAVEYDLRSLIFSHLTGLSFSFYDRVQTGQLVSRANSDIRSVQLFLTLAPILVVGALQVVVAFFLMASVHLLLALVAVSTLPLVYLLGLRMRSKLFPVSWIVAARTADVATVVEENVSGSRVVKAFAAEEHQVRRLALAARRLRWAAHLQIGIRARYSPFLHDLPRLGLAMVLLYGGWLAVEGRVTVGTLVEFNAYVVLVQGPFALLGFLMMQGQRAAASAQRIFAILDEHPEVSERPGAIDLVDSRGEVVFDDVRFGYADGPDVLNGFSLRIEPGEVVALVGRTGTGKSTVARLLARFYDVRSGSVRVDGHDVRDLTLASLRAHVGLVLDDPFLFSATVRENIAFGRPDATQAEIEAVARAAGITEFVERLPAGFDTVVGERGYTLSGGQRQRIAIARTLLVDPRVLVLDDATSSIDVHVEQEVLGALRSLMQSRTTLVIAHRLSTIALADRVVLLAEGRVAASGTHTDLLATVPAYAEVLARADNARHQPNGNGQDRLDGGHRRVHHPDGDDDVAPRVRPNHALPLSGLEGLGG